MGKNNTVNSYTEFFYKAFRNILLVSIPLVVVLGLVLSSLHSSASTDQIEFSLSVSCTMSSVVNAAHTKEITNGTYHSDVGKTTITALCNDGNGYTVYATGYGNNEEGNNKLINSSYPQYSINTGLATSGLTSQWAMKLSNIPDDPSSTPPVIESAYDDTYGLVPDNWTKVVSRQSGTTDMNLGSSFTTTYSIYTSSSQFAGTYRGQVKYALLHPYSNNNTPSFDSFDKAFAFYEKDKVVVTDPITGNTGSYYKMQDMESGICNNISSTGESTATQLVDIRDNKLYWIAKLDDNNCWMTQNLDLDIVAGSTNLTSSNTDLSTNENIYATSNTIYALKGTGDTYGYTYENGIATWIPERSTIAYGQLNNNTWSDSYTAPYSYDAGVVYPDVNVSSEHGLAGNYYNWTASLASNDSTNATGNPANSICPKGWRLPNVTNKEFGNLLVGYDIISTNTSISYLTDVNSMGAAPIYFVRDGHVSNGSLSNSGITGYYWSGSFDNGGNHHPYYLFYDSSDIRPQNSRARPYGWSIRCLAR